MATGSLFVNPNADMQNRTEMNNYRSYLAANMEECQIAIEVPDAGSGGYHRVGITDANKNYSWMICNGEFDSLVTTVNGKEPSIVGAANKVLKIAGTGTGATAGIMTDTGSRIGVSVSAPQNKFHIHEASESDVLMQISNAVTGNADSFDGFTFGIVGTDKVFRTGYQSPFKFQYENPSSPGNFIDIMQLDYATSSITSEYFTINAFTTINNSLLLGGTLKGTTASGLNIWNDTADGSDTKTIIINGGGGYETSRGGCIVVRGNEAVAGGGNVELIPGGTGVIKLGSDLVSTKADSLQIYLNTEDGTDNKYMYLCGGGGPSGGTGRGAGIYLFGNDVANNNGILRLRSGDGNASIPGAINLVSRVYCGATRPTKEYYKLAIDNTFQFNTFITDMTENNAVIQQHNYYDGTNYRYNGIGGASIISSTGGEIKIRTSPNIAYDAVITWNEGIRVDTSGKVGFGVTSTLVEKVEVSGNIKATGSVKATDFGDDWINHSANMTITNIIGYSSLTEKFLFYKKEGKQVTVVFFFSGTSNADSCRFVLPVVPVNLNNRIEFFGVGKYQDSSSGNHGCIIVIQPLSTQHAIVVPVDNPSMNTTGNKICQGQLTYYI